ncbi:conserved hypothetical protein [Parafrankia sp. EAN1pec]|uniref:hypothetical protein n=1 Tax=Parafrankia sp. (strain EAN1pec) TaxID=298653 RepID=UPI0000542C18|nr:conserved hypothetical protein [Frankia sp. EAN1pec]
MTLPRTVADVLARHVTFKVECIDRMYLNVYIPQLQFPLGLMGFLSRRLGMRVTSTAPLASITERFVTAVRRFAVDHEIPLVDFARGQRKDDVMHEHLSRFTKPEGVVFVGRAQEKTPLFRTEKRRDSEGKTYPWIVKTTGVVNHFYFYCVDDDFGPFFLKFCSYFPYNAKLCLNGNHWAQRQAAKSGIGFTPMDNAFAAVDDPAALQRIYDSLGPEQIDGLLRKWLKILPHPFTGDDQDAGYTYDVSVLQAEFSLTQTLDRPLSGRVFFEQVIRDNLDLGRPDQVSLIFDRELRRGKKRPTPAGSAPACSPKASPPACTSTTNTPRSSSTTRKDERYAPKPRSTTPAISASGSRWSTCVLKQVDFQANRRLLDVQTISHDPTDGQAALTTVTDPVLTTTGRRVAGLRFTDPRAQALLSAILVFRLLTTCADYARTASSNASPAPTATSPPAPASGTPCSSPVSTTDSSAPASPNSPTPIPATRHHFDE